MDHAPDNVSSTREKHMISFQILSRRRFTYKEVWISGLERDVPNIFLTQIKWNLDATNDVMCIFSIELMLIVNTNTFF